MTASLLRTLEHWVAAPAPAGEIMTPAHLAYAALRWIHAPVPGTAAEAMRQAGLWDFDHPRDFDADDWWYRCVFRRSTADVGHRVVLQLDGLATLADVWLNGHSVLTSDNMFQEHRVDVTETLDDANELVICFRSLATALAQRRPRPRWKTRLVSHRQLRWFRTSLLGRMPGWSPPVAAVGPWRGVSLQRLAPGALTDVELRPSLDAQCGIVDVTCSLVARPRATVTARLVVGGAAADLSAEYIDGVWRLSGRCRVPDAALWWPHTHGRPALYPCTVEIGDDGARAHHDLGGVGFRRIEARRDDEGFSLAVNGVPVFCRGACWTVEDIALLDGSPAAIARDLMLLQKAGANMVRIGGTMVYQTDAFYRLCDELGLLVWQDFMFANMDYPAGHEAFRRSVETEATQQLMRWRRHACMAVYCGNSEVEQQAAMVGAAREIWRNDVFAQLLPDLCERLDPGVPYVPSTPSGGALPFHTGTGVSHYYGVGAYRRPLSEVRAAHVRFTPECLGFANVPEPDLVDLAMDGAPPATHDPRWKRGTPRDTGAAWDFEDVRDHYLAELFALDPGRLRVTDMARYLDLSRVTTGEVMSRVFSEWRSGGTCGGALVWFLRDLWPGAGWGVLDSRGVPKACFYYLKRAWQPQAVVITDEGLNGIRVHAINDADGVLSGSIELTLLQNGHVIVAQASVPVLLPPRDRAAFGSDELLDAFHDVAYAYRFGPPTHDIVAATLYGDSGEVISEAFWFPDASAAARPRRCAVIADARPIGDATYALSVTANRFLFAAHVDAAGYAADDNYFCLMPGRTKVVHLEAVTEEPAELKGFVEAINLDRAAPIAIASHRLVAS